jgi:hypothetical protein
VERINNKDHTSPLPDAEETLKLRFSNEVLDQFSQGRSKAEVLTLLETVSAWMAQVNTQNHDGVTLTPAIVHFLASGNDTQAQIGELDRLRQETRIGRFSADNELQRELEYRRFLSESKCQPAWPQKEPQQRAVFDALPLLPPPQNEGPYPLSAEDILESKRAAYEAKALLDFLRQFRSHTDRPITVLGNERYGRLFVVEPLEPYLRGGFHLHYERVPSHGSMRLTVPHYLERFQRNGFAPEFMLHLSTHMPHVVLVDVCSPRATEHYTKIPRGIRDLVNWFMVFNHIRAEGDRSQYEKHSSLPAYQIAELEKWWEFEVVRRRISPWIKPGPTYGIAYWAPELKEEVLMGNLVIAAKPAVSGGGPQVIAANPAIYRTTGDDLPELLQTTHPYYFNDPEKRIKAEILPGFGDHGFETRVKGFTTDEYVAAVQRQIGLELECMITNAGGE